jgi:hypothetical protein
LGLFEELGQLLVPGVGISVGKIFNGLRRPKGHEGLGQSLGPEGILHCQRDYQATPRCGGCMANPGTEVNWPLPRIGEVALGRHPEDHIRPLQSRPGQSQKPGRSFPTVGLDAQKADRFEEGIFSEGRCIDRPIVEPVRIEPLGNGQKDQRIPPAGMVRVDQHRLVAEIRGIRGVLCFEQSDCMEVPP